MVIGWLAPVDSALRRALKFGTSASPANERAAANMLRRQLRQSEVRSTTRQFQGEVGLTLCFAVVPTDDTPREPFRSQGPRLAASRWDTATFVCVFVLCAKVWHVHSQLPLQRGDDGH